MGRDVGEPSAERCLPRHTGVEGWRCKSSGWHFGWQGSPHRDVAWPELSLGYQLRVALNDTVRFRFVVSCCPLPVRLLFQGVLLLSGCWNRGSWDNLVPTGGGFDINYLEPRFARVFPGGFPIGMPNVEAIH